MSASVKMLLFAGRKLARLESSSKEGLMGLTGNLILIFTVDSFHRPGLVLPPIIGLVAGWQKCHLKSKEETLGILRKWKVPTRFWVLS